MQLIEFPDTLDSVATFTDIDTVRRCAALAR